MSLPPSRKGLRCLVCPFVDVPKGPLHGLLGRDPDRGRRTCPSPHSTRLPVDRPLRPLGGSLLPLYLGPRVTDPSPGAPFYVDTPEDVEGSGVSSGSGKVLTWGLYHKHCSRGHRDHSSVQVLRNRIWGSPRRFPRGSLSLEPWQGTTPREL